MGLDLRTDEGNHLIAQQGDGDVQAAFSAAVQPDDERIGLTVTFKRPGLIGGISKRYITGLAGVPAGEGSLVEVIGLGDKVPEGFVRLAVDGGELLLSHLKDFPLLQAHLDAVFLPPDALINGKAQAAADSLFKSQGNILAFRIESASGV